MSTLSKPWSRRAAVPPQPTEGGKPPVKLKALLQRDYQHEPRCLLQFPRKSECPLDVNDTVEMYQPNNPSTCRLFVRIHFVESTRLMDYQIRFPASFIERFRLKVNEEVILKRVTDLEPATASLVEVSFRGKYVGRFDMWRFKEALCHQCVQLSESLKFGGVEARISDIFLSGNRKSHSAHIGGETKIVLRSSSVKMCIIFPVTAEIFEYHSDGRTFFEVCMSFFDDLLKQWAQSDVRHLVTIILATRIWYPDATPADFARLPKQEQAAFMKTTDGKWYRDFYQVVCQELLFSAPLRTSILMTLKHDASLFWEKIGIYQHTCDRMVGRVDVSTSRMANTFEALHLALRCYDQHYIDRRFDRTGLSLMLVTAGTGVVKTTRHLFRTVEEYVLEEGVGIDWICVSAPLCFNTPLVYFECEDLSTATAIPKHEFPGDAWHRYERPEWIHHCFYDSDTRTLFEAGSRTLNMTHAIFPRFLCNHGLKVDDSAELPAMKPKDVCGIDKFLLSQRAEAFDGFPDDVSGDLAEVRPRARRANRARISDVPIPVSERPARKLQKKKQQNNARNQKRRRKLPTQADFERFDNDCFLRPSREIWPWQRILHDDTSPGSASAAASVSSRDPPRFFAQPHLESGAEASDLVQMPVASRSSVPTPTRRQPATPHDRQRSGQQSARSTPGPRLTFTPAIYTPSVRRHRQHCPHPRKKMGKVKLLPRERLLPRPREFPANMEIGRHMFVFRRPADQPPPTRRQSCPERIFTSTATALDELRARKRVAAERKQRRKEEMHVRSLGASKHIRRRSLPAWWPEDDAQDDIRQFMPKHTTWFTRELQALQPPVLPNAEGRVFEPYEDRFRQQTSLDMLRRWQHVFAAVYKDSDTPYGPLWKSLITPACLPLSTAYPPSEPAKTLMSFPQYRYCFRDPEAEIDAKEAQAGIIGVLLMLGAQYCEVRVGQMFNMKLLDFTLGEEDANGGKAQGEDSGTASTAQTASAQSGGQRFQSAQPRDSANRGNRADEDADDAGSGKGDKPTSVGTMWRFGWLFRPFRLFSSSSRRSGQGSEAALTKPEEDTQQELQKQPSPVTEAVPTSVILRLLRGHVVVSQEGSETMIAASLPETSVNNLEKPPYVFGVIPFRRQEVHVVPTELHFPSRVPRPSVHDQPWYQLAQLLQQPLDVRCPPSQSLVNVAGFWRVRYVVIPKPSNSPNPPNFIQFWLGLKQLIGEGYRRHVEEVGRDPSRSEDKSRQASGTPAQTSLPKTPEGVRLTDDLQVGGVKGAWGMTNKQVLSCAIWLNMTEDESSRREWAVMYYDSAYHPKRCFHFEIQWFVATGAYVGNFIRKVRSKGMGQGFEVCKVGVEPMSHEACNRNPFRVPRHVDLDWHPDDETAREAFLAGILEQLGFVLDMYAATKDPPCESPRMNPPYRRTQYIHYSGVAVAQIPESGWFLIYHANLLANDLNFKPTFGTGVHLLTSEDSNVLQSILRLCGDTARLQVVWRSVQEERARLKAEVEEWRRKREEERRQQAGHAAQQQQQQQQQQAGRGNGTSKP